MSWFLQLEWSLNVYVIRIFGRSFGTNNILRKKKKKKKKSSRFLSTTAVCCKELQGYVDSFKLFSSVIAQPRPTSGETLLFLAMQGLMKRSAMFPEVGKFSEQDPISVGCNVAFFAHFLWLHSCVSLPASGGLSHRPHSREHCSNGNVEEETGISFLSKEESSQECWNVFYLPLVPI